MEGEGTYIAGGEFTGKRRAVAGGQPWMQFEHPGVPRRRRGCWETRLVAVSPGEVTALAGSSPNGGAALFPSAAAPASTGRTRAGSSGRRHRNELVLGVGSTLQSFVGRFQGSGWYREVNRQIWSQRYYRCYGGTTAQRYYRYHSGTTAGPGIFHNLAM